MCFQLTKLSANSIKNCQNCSQSKVTIWIELISHITLFPHILPNIFKFDNG